MTDVTSGISLAVFRYFPAAGISPLNLRRVYGIMSESQAGVMELVDVVDSKSTASDGVPVRVRPPAPARRELRKFATTFYALHKKSSLTCSAAPRFKTVTASLGHSFVTPTWELLRMF